MISDEMLQIGKKAKLASAQLSVAGTADKNRALTVIAQTLRENAAVILAANAEDLDNAAANGMSAVMQDRLRLNAERIEAIACAVEHVVDLNDPVGVIDSGHTTPNGLRIQRVHVPLGVIGMIYESRPNVTVDAAVLCLKSSNAVILRGGRDALCSNRALASLMRDAVASAGMNPDVIQLVSNTAREISMQMMQMNEYMDVLIPRGGAGLIEAVVKNATVPVIQTGVGNCHVYVDDSADLEMAAGIVHNAKTSRPSVCNACESLLVHESTAQEFLPIVQERFRPFPVTMVGCERTRAILGEQIDLATEQDYATEFLDYKISVKVVDSVEEAVAHINRFTTHHSECIVTKNLNHADFFTGTVDAVAVYVNASTRFTDGEMFGLGAEIGISTQKLHARGPMGLNELTTIKYVIQGNGQIR